MTEAKIQHYVPKFLLRNFGTGKKDQVWVFDKQLGRSFQTNAKNIASESRFYDFEIEGTTHSLESSLSNVESKTKPIVEKIISEDSAGNLSDTERGMLAAFMAIQFVRTKAFRMQWADVPRMLKQKVEALKMRVAPGSEAETAISEPSENQVKIQTARMLLEAPEAFGPHFLNKSWFVARTTISHPFWIADNPISLQNFSDHAPYGNLGLAVPGIEIYLPLSATRALALWCQSRKIEVNNAARTLRSHDRALINKVLRNPEGLLALDAALNSGRALIYEPKHVMNFNSLQVTRSERYLVSPTNDFEVAKRMIRDHPSLRFGQRLEDSTMPPQQSIDGFDASQK